MFLLLSNLGSIIEIFSSVDQRDTVLVKPQPRAVSSSILHGARYLASLQMMRVANTIGQMGTHSVINLFHVMQDEGRLQVRYTRVAFGAGCAELFPVALPSSGYFNERLNPNPRVPSPTCLQSDTWSAGKQAIPATDAFMNRHLRPTMRTIATVVLAAKKFKSKAKKASDRQAETKRSVMIPSRRKTYTE